MTYGSKTRSLLADVGLKFERAEMQMIRWMCGISLKDRRTNEELRRLVEVEPITTFIRSGRLRWYGHVMRKGDEDWVNKCMEYRVEGRRPVGRSRKKWLERVEADITIEGGKHGGFKSMGDRMKEANGLIGMVKYAAERSGSKYVIGRMEDNDC